MMSEFRLLRLKNEILKENINSKQEYGLVLTIVVIENNSNLFMLEFDVLFVVFIKVLLLKYILTIIIKHQGKQSKTVSN